MEDFSARIFKIKVSFIVRDSRSAQGLGVRNLIQSLKLLRKKRRKII